MIFSFIWRNFNILMKLVNRISKDLHASNIAFNTNNNIIHISVPKFNICLIATFTNFLFWMVHKNVCYKRTLPISRPSLLFGLDIFLFKILLSRRGKKTYRPHEELIVYVFDSETQSIFHFLWSFGFSFWFFERESSSNNILSI